MARKAMWMVFLLGALLALSVSAVFAAGDLRPTQAILTPETNVSKVGTSNGVSRGFSTKSYNRGDCPFSKGDSASAY